ncbi:glycogen debranching enzyme/alpha-amylase [Lentisphaera araneosa HTCC2155]|uniref:Glycogen debranching enzyme/alpha-amylase n=1 Tax=Lentisphaera araneosa HTCC2155 TaxID=313628 RepID=A6DP08_9BACT|nr:amylo-alpha-1,6-glucosidase [Lentisphaera araneosa]EDM26540.1 glycogen debranching enzyme/alpha-amylase [Lentisphaera araneosa HTCC2155]
MSQAKLSSSPSTGDHLVKFSGDLQKFTLQSSVPGKAFLRTNLNQSAIRNEQVIRHIENDETEFDLGWNDYPMNDEGNGNFALTLPLSEAGHFRAKAYLKLDDGELLWQDGPDIVLNIEPNSSRYANSIYCAFPRQFGKNKTLLNAPSHDELKTLDEEGYTVIPPSGKFSDLICELDHIFDDLGCNILHLLPINPTPTSYARMGRYGSPYAALDFTAVNPELCNFNLKTTPVQQFCELADAVHQKQGRIIIDIAINHTGWASKIHETNPEWVRRHDNGDIYQPGAWGTVWEDLTELNHKDTELWVYLADVFLTWCERGVDGFRCDAGYMIPEPAWKYIAAKVREQYPETIFLLEGLGGPWETTENMLNHCNLNWAYSELFQNYSKDQVSAYMKYSIDFSQKYGPMVHYAETHDNARLADTSPLWAKSRTTLSALLSHNGCFGFTNGVEWLATEKVNVHGASGLNWGADENLISEIKELNELLLTHPAFFENSLIKEIPLQNSSLLAYERRSKDGSSPLLILINLDMEHGHQLELETPFSCPDLLIGSKQIDSQNLNFQVEPGEILCLGTESDKIASADKKKQIHHAQRVIANLAYKTNKFDLCNNLEAQSQTLLAGPMNWLNEQNIIPTTWEFPFDLKRQVPCPVNSSLLFKAPHNFNIFVFGRKHDSFLAHDGQHYILLLPLEDQGKISYEPLNLEINTPEGIQKHQSTLLRLTTIDQPYTDKYPVEDCNKVILDTNGKGAMMRLNTGISNIWTRYDALLAANLSPDYPENRHIMWRRNRIYVDCHHATYELSEKFLTEIRGNGRNRKLIYELPLGHHRCLILSVQAFMLPGENATTFIITREKSSLKEASQTSVKIYIRLDLEDRDFHSDTKAGAGLEGLWASKVKSTKRELQFSPANDRQLRITSSNGKFMREDEWSYNQYQRNEALRGLESHCDLYSPGFFLLDLKPGDSCTLLGQVIRNKKQAVIKITDIPFPEEKALNSYIDQLREAVGHYVVARDGMKTVIAGYPWFLDWGRDTLICCRGLISAGFGKDVVKILQRFASFEEAGTLPNSIHGADAANRDTSDAPLWFFVACDDYINESGDEKVLKLDCNGRSILQIMESIATNYIAGAPNGIKVDPESLLVYSPSHFTWMDTNYPAGTPREGYPVEIQVFWIKALNILHKYTKQDKWKELADKALASFIQYFWDEQRGFLSDCLHCKTYHPAAQSPADDALRSNQLFAITLDVIQDIEMQKAIFESSSCLLIPGAIRSLADRKNEFPLPVYSNYGKLLNNPENPYFHHYEGDEDTRRKPAYHNGTAWNWPFPSYPEAMLKIYGEEAIPTVKSLLYSSRILFNTGAVEQIPEVMDGSAPHTPRGCDAQAWSVTELIRVLQKCEK